MIRLLIAILFTSTFAQASSTRTVDADSLRASNAATTLTLPAATDTLVGKATTDILTNKTMSGASNTFTLLPIAVNQQQEVPTGTINSSNVTFTLAFTPVSAASLELYLDGILQIGTTDYSLATATITFVTAPATGQTIRAIYPRY